MFSNISRNLAVGSIITIGCFTATKREITLESIKRDAKFEDIEIPSDDKTKTKLFLDAYIEYERTRLLLTHAYTQSRLKTFISRENSNDNSDAFKVSPKSDYYSESFDLPLLNPSHFYFGVLKPVVTFLSTKDKDPYSSRIKLMKRDTIRMLERAKNDVNVVSPVINRQHNDTSSSSSPAPGAAAAAHQKKCLVELNNIGQMIVETKCLNYITEDELMDLRSNFQFLISHIKKVKNLEKLASDFDVNSKKMTDEDEE